MMKEEYEEPQATIIRLDGDVIATSPNTLEPDPWTVGGSTTSG